MVTLEVTSAFVVDGRVELPGRVVEVPRADAAGLVARGKAVVAPAGTGGDAEDAADDGDTDTAQDAPAEPAGRGRRNRG